MSTSLDGFIAGADDSPKQPVGVGGERLFDGDVQGGMVAMGQERQAGHGQVLIRLGDGRGDRPLSQALTRLKAQR